MIIEFLADGFEEIEALTPYDMLKRAGQNIVTVSVSGRDTVLGSHGIEIKADRTVANFSPEYDFAAEMIILPGGMPGTKILFANQYVRKALTDNFIRGNRIAAICAAPMILGQLGFLEGKNATCFPGFECYLRNAKVADTSSGGKVITDGNITTASGMGVALQFGAELVSVICGKEKAESLLESVKSP